MHKAGAGQSLDRRDFIRTSSAGMVGLGLAGSLAGLACGKDTPLPAKPAKAKSVIEIALWGGMTQFETFDPKPNASFRSPFKAIPTNVPGIQICELMPRLAKMADKYAILRTMLNPRTGHGEAAYVMTANAPYPADITTTHPSGKVVYPAVGAIVAMKKRLDGTYRGDIPPWVSVGPPPYGVTEGFLGPKWKPFSTGERSGMSAGDLQRLGDRQHLLAALQPAADAENREAARTATALRQEVFRTMTSDAQKVFSLADEPDALKDRYGRNEFGKACLLARRLAQYGVPFISVPWGGDGKHSWDMHEQLSENCRALVPMLDQTVSALVEDLSDKGLLDNTIVVVFAENGKGPKLEGSSRGHWGRGYSVFLAGGGFKGGRVVGEMDDNGEFVKSRPIYPWDMWESIYLQLGIDPQEKLPNPYGCVVYISQADACGLPRGGILKEIM
jgi:uncharacterized protein (DUF1501 family)